MTSVLLLEVLLSVSLQLSLLVLLAAWTARRARHAKTHCAIWQITFLSILGLAILGCCVPHLRLFHPWPALTPSQILDVIRWETVLAIGLLTIWASGVGVTGLTLCLRAWQLSQFLKSCDPLELSSVHLSLRARTLLGSDDARQVRILTTDFNVGPFCTQFHRPYLVLPNYLFAEDPNNLDRILVHELAHLRTGHPLQLFLQRIVECLYWFHPLVRWASRKCSAAREFVCDEAAIETPEDVLAYLKMLSHCAEREFDFTLAVDLGLRGGDSVLSERIERLLSLAKPNVRGASQPASIPLLSCGAFGAMLIVSLLWLPINSLASTRSSWSPWPIWSAGVLHSLGYPARDYEQFDPRRDLYEIISLRQESQHAGALTTPRDRSNSP